jgi:hypothetical protein
VPEKKNKLDPGEEENLEIFLKWKKIRGGRVLPSSEKFRAPENFEFF